MKVKKNKLFKSRAQMIIYIILTIIIMVLFVVIGTHDFNPNIETEGEQFNQVFTNVEKDNVFIFGDVTDVNSIINGKSEDAIILFGFKNNEWTSYYAEYINDVAIELGIKKVIYYDFELDRKEKNGTYETIVNSLDVYVTFNDYNTADIYAPTLVVVKDGEVIAFINETSLRNGNVTPEIYWDQYKVEEFKSTLRTIFNEYLKGQQNG